MVVRSGMNDLIIELRAMTDAGTADYTLNGLYYFTDEQLQSRLDQTRNNWTYKEMRPVEKQVPGSVDYTEYKIPVGRWFERSSGGSEVFVIRDGTAGIVNASDYTVDYDAGVVTFLTTTGGSSRYVDCRTYDLNRAAAQIWYWKAAHVTSNVNWRSDNHRVDASHERRACMEMAQLYANSGNFGAKSHKVVRGDTA